MSSEKKKIKGVIKRSRVRIRKGGNYQRIKIERKYWISFSAPTAFRSFTFFGVGVGYEERGEYQRRQINLK